MAESVLSRLEVRERILECEACELHKECTPVPFHGPVPAFIAVLGEGPGKEEAVKGQPFVGPAGRLLRTELETVGLDPESLSWMNVTCCWPGPATNPNDEQVAACVPNRDMQLALLQPTWLLVFGQTALGAIRPDLTIKHGRGRPFAYGGAVAYACYHPSAALRNSVMLQPLREDLQKFVDLVDAGIDVWWQGVSDRCIQCVDFVERYDESGIGWCPRHDPRTGAAARRKPKEPVPAAPAIVETQAMFDDSAGRNGRSRMTHV